MRSQQWHPCGSSSHCWWHRPAASADAPKALTASPNDNELLAANVFQAGVWPHDHDKCEPPPPANTSARPADTPYGQCTPAAVTAMVATQLSMQLSQMIVQARHPGVHAPHTQAVLSQAAKEAHSQKPWRGSAHAVWQNVGCAAGGSVQSTAV